jgi:type II secretory pathway pseudopilin PulG
MKLRRKARGVTLVELLIVGVMTGILSTGLGVMLLNFSQGAVNNISTSDVQGDIQGAVSYLNTDLRLARYLYRQNGVECKVIANLKSCPAQVQQTTEGADATIKYGSSNRGTINIAGFTNQSNASIELAFWVRSTKLTTPGCVPFSNIPQGDFLSVPTAQLGNAPFGDSASGGATPGVCSLVSFGTPNSVPAYKFVVYYTTLPPAGSPFKGPRVLYRWESGAMPIPSSEFALFNGDDPPNIEIPSTSYVYNPPSPTGGTAVADYLSATNPVSIANSPSNPQSVTVSIQGSMDNVQGQVNIQTKTSNLSRLLFSATTYARNICAPGAACPPDPK